MIELKIYTNIKPFFTRGWGPNKENFTEKFNKQSKLGWGPNKEDFNVNSTSLTPLLD
ncbi:hypothetical protein CTJ11_08890 [Staphylococcus epidermidis]|nr:hypothetical protein CTJ11_08890 [Staphylococcus epidermidis]